MLPPIDKMAALAALQEVVAQRPHVNFVVITSDESDGFFGLFVSTPIIVQQLGMLRSAQIMIEAKAYNNAVAAVEEVSKLESFLLMDADQKVKN